MEIIIKEIDRLDLISTCDPGEYHLVVKEKDIIDGDRVLEDYTHPVGIRFLKIGPPTPEPDTETHIVPCEKCGHKTVLATAFISEFGPDQEPYESGKVEPIGSGEDTIYDNAEVGIHYCEKCNTINDIWIESPAPEPKPKVDEYGMEEWEEAHTKIMDEIQAEWVNDKEYHKKRFSYTGIRSSQISAVIAYLLKKGFIQMPRCKCGKGEQTE